MKTLMLVHDVTTWAWAYVGLFKVMKDARTWIKCNMTLTMNDRISLRSKCRCISYRPFDIRSVHASYGDTTFKTNEFRANCAMSITRSIDSDLGVGNEPVEPA